MWVTTGAKGCWTLWNLSYRWFKTTWWGTWKPKTCSTERAFKSWAICPLSEENFNSYQINNKHWFWFFFAPLSHGISVIIFFVLTYTTYLIINVLVTNSSNIILKSIFYINTAIKEVWRGGILICKCQAWCDPLCSWL